MTTSNIKIYTDGGARGNPGEAACAFVIISNGRIVHKESKYLGVGTNNEAEYNGIIEALNWLVKNNYKKSAVFFIDSELVVNQLNGIYKLKSNNLKPLYLKIKNIENFLGNQINYYHTPREKNKLADKLVNEELDRMKYDVFINEK